MKSRWLKMLLGRSRKSRKRAIGYLVTGTCLAMAILWLRRSASASWGPLPRQLPRGSTDHLWDYVKYLSTKDFARKPRDLAFSADHVQALNGFGSMGALILRQAGRESAAAFDITGLQLSSGLQVSIWLKRLGSNVTGIGPFAPIPRFIHWGNGWVNLEEAGILATLEDCPYIGNGSSLRAWHPPPAEFVFYYRHHHQRSFDSLSTKFQRLFSYRSKRARLLAHQEIQNHILGMPRVVDLQDFFRRIGIPNNRTIEAELRSIETRFPAPGVDGLPLVTGFDVALRVAP